MFVDATFSNSTVIVTGSQHLVAAKKAKICGHPFFPFFVTYFGGHKLPGKRQIPVIFNTYSFYSDMMGSI